MGEKKLRYELTADSSGFEKGFQRGIASANALDKSITNLGKSVYALGATYLGTQGIGAIIKTADSYSLLESKLKLVSKGSEEFAKNYNELFKISQTTGSSFEANAANFSNLSLALRDTNITSKESLQIFEAVNKSLVVAGASTEEASSFMLQFRQALGSGRLQGEEFRAMMESNSYFGGLLAKTLQTDVAGLREMSKEGKLTTDVLRTAFPEMAQQINSDFDSIQKTIGRAMVELKNAFGDVLNDANKAEGGTSKLASGISGLAKTITDNKATISDVFSGIIKGAAATVEGIANVSRSIQGLAIVAASKDKSLTDWIMGDANTMKQWQAEMGNGTAFLKDRLVDVRQAITDTQNTWGSWSEKAGKLEALRAEETALIAKIKEQGSATTAVANETEAAMGKSSAAVSRYKDAWQVVAEAKYTKEYFDAEVKFYAEQDKASKQHQKEVAKTIHLETDERMQALQMQKELLREGVKAEEQAAKEKQSLIDKAKAETEAAYNQMIGKVKSSKQTELGAWEEATNAELDELERLSDGSEKYTDALNEYRQIKHKEMLGRIARDEKQSLTEMQKLWIDFGHDALNNFENVLASGLKGEFETLGDAWNSFTDAMLNSFLDMIAKMVTAWVASEIYEMWTGNESGFTFSGMFGGVGSSGGNAVAGIGGELIKQKMSSVIQNEVASYFAADAGAAAAAALSTNLAEGTATPAIMEAAANSGSGYGSLLSTAGGVVGVGAGAYGMYSGLQNIGQGNYAVGGVQTALGGYSTYQGATTLGLLEEGTATAAYNSASTAISSYFSGAATTDVGAAIGGAAADAFAANAAADAAGTYAASATAAEFGAAGTAGSGTAAGGGSAAAGAGVTALGYAAGVVTVAAALGGIAYYWENGAHNTRDQLNDAGVSPAGFGKISGVGTDGQLVQLSEEMKDALGLLKREFREFDAASVDAANGVMVLADNIVGDGGLITGVNYSIETFSAASQTWERSQVEFSDLLDTMSEMGPVSGEAIAVTADYVAEMAGVPTVADELARAFLELQSGIYGVAGAAVSGAGTLAQAMSMIGGLTYTAGYHNDDQSNPNIVGSDAWRYTNQSSQPAWDSQDQGYDPEWSMSHQDGGMADGGTILPRVPNGDDVWRGYKYGEVVLPVDTSRLLDRKLKDGSIGGGQTIIHNHFYVDGKEIATSVMPAVDNHIARRERSPKLTGRSII